MQQHSCRLAPVAFSSRQEVCSFSCAIVVCVGVSHPPVLKLLQVCIKIISRQKFRNASGALRLLPEFMISQWVSVSCHPPVFSHCPLFWGPLLRSARFVLSFVWSAADAVERGGGGDTGAEGRGLPHLPGVKLAEECFPAGLGAAERAATEDDNDGDRPAADCERLVGHRAPHQLLWRLAHGVRSFSHLRLLLEPL